MGKQSEHITENISALINAKLLPEQVSTIQAHIAVCAECASIVEELGITFVEPSLIQNVMDNREEKFVENVLKTGQKESASVKAGFSVGMSNKLLKRERVRNAVLERLQAAQDVIQVDVENVLYEIRRIAFSDMRKLYHENGELKAPYELDDDTAAAVASIKKKEQYDKDGNLIGTTWEYRMWDKSNAHDKFMKYYALYAELGSAANPLTIEKRERIDLSRLKPDDIAQLSEMLKRVMLPMAIEGGQ